MERKISDSFDLWLSRVSDDSAKRAAETMKCMIFMPKSDDCEVWQLIEEIGDPEITDATFLKAASASLARAAHLRKELRLRRSLF